jgi:transcriptional regulator GlxA family with amidase domain
MLVRMTHTVGILMFDDVEVLDFAGPYEVFTTAARMHQRDVPGAEPLFVVRTISTRGQPVRARAGLRVEVDHAFDQHPRLDVLLVPGGVVTAELERPEVLDWLRRTAASAALVTSVCTGAFLLARAGLLAGCAVTTHWEDLDDLVAAHPELEVRRDVRWVDEGARVTSAGISAGLDMSLHLVERLHSRALAVRTARQMDLEWNEGR